MAPFGAVEVRELQRIGHDRSEQIIEGHMELRSDVAGLKIEDQRDRTGVPITDANIDTALRAGLPSRDLLASRDSVIEDVEKTAPHMDVPKLGLFPAGSGEDIHWGEPIDL
jgi:hypothetical protein